jgi:hypothetical protein
MSKIKVWMRSHLLMLLWKKREAVMHFFSTRNRMRFVLVGAT